MPGPATDAESTRYPILRWRSGPDGERPSSARAPFDVD